MLKRRQLRKLAKLEQRRMKIKAMRLLSQVKVILLEEYGRQIYQVTDLDKLRLLKLDIWCQKYKVSLRFILRAILPYYFSAQKKYQRGRGNSLGIRIATLCGKKSEEILGYWLSKAFPDRENLNMWQHERQKEIIDSRLGIDEDITHRKSLLECRSVKDYIRKYRQHIRAERESLEQVTDNPNNKLRAYRDSPWI